MTITEEGAIQNLDHLLSSDQLKEDFSLLRSVYEEGHAGLYVHRNETEISTKFEEFTTQLDSPSTIQEFYRMIAKFIDFIGDGHSTVNFNSKIRNQILNEVGIFPIKPSFIDKKMYVFRNFSENETISTGSEILKVNNTSVNEIINDLLQYVYIDGFGADRKFTLLERDFNKIFAFTYGAKSVFDIEYRNTGEKEVRKAKLAAITFDEMKEIQEKRFPEDIAHPLYSLTSHSDLKAAILTIKSFNSNKAMAKITGIRRYADEDKFGVFLKKAFRIVQEGGIENLIIDVRGNSGGREDYGALLYSYLATSDFQYFDAVCLKKKKYAFFKTTNNKMLQVILNILRKDKINYGYKIHNPFFMPPLYKTHRKKKNVFTGDVSILIDGGSFSATCEFLTTCHRFQRVKFVGEETRGAYIGNNSGLMASVSLPHSKLVLRVPLFRFIMPVSQESNHRGIVPDYEIKPTVDDISKGKDTVLEYTLKNLILS